jgi:hypothetical protein
MTKFVTSLSNSPSRAIREIAHVRRIAIELGVVAVDGALILGREGLPRFVTEPTSLPI